jgi:prophage lp1 protein 65
MKRYRKVKIPKSPKAFLVSLIMIGIIGCYTAYQNNLFIPKKEETPVAQTSYQLENIPSYQGDAYVVINQNEPEFTDIDKNFTGENYSDLDALGRCGVAMARVGIDTMPTEERGSIGMIKPSGWHTVKYDIVSGKYLYNRCHLIGYQLTGENANEKNLITCTRSMNTTGMLEWENKVADHVKETKNHVLYRVTPMFEDDNLVATGVQIEAKSLEDNGQGVKFNVFVYNVQDGIEIDYKTGESQLKE